LLIVLAGLAMTAWRAVRGPDRAVSLLLVVFPVLYFAVMAGSRQIYARYTLPLLPFACLLAALAAESAVRVARRATQRTWVPEAVTLAMCLLLVVPLAASSMTYDRRLGQVATQDLAYRWLEAHAEPGASVVAEGFVLRLPAPRFKGTAVLSLIDKRYDEYAAGRIQYLVASSDRFKPALTASERNPAAYAAYQALFTQATEVARFDGSQTVPGPDIRIYRIAAADVK
jgi:hypothetical protein